VQFAYKEMAHVANSKSQCRQKTTYHETHC